MRREPHTDAAVDESPRDIRLSGGCLVCGGDLDVRVSGATARSFCASCRWMSKPHMVRQDDGIHVVHPAGGIA
jgi:hypothetical protein